MKQPEFKALRGVSFGLVLFNLGYLVSSLALAAGAVALLWWHPSWYTALFLVVVVPSRQHALLNISHECMHGTFLRGKTANHWAGVFVAGLVGSNFRASRAHHFAHHRYLGTPDDPDHDLHDGADKDSRLGVLLHFARAVSGVHAVRVFFRKPVTNVGMADRRADALGIVVIQALLIGLITYTLSFWAYVFFWAAPIVTLTIGLHLVRSFCEHAMARHERNAEEVPLITTHASWIEAFMFSPYNLQYHAEHHMFPMIPGPRLPRLRTLMARCNDLPHVVVRRGYLSALRRYVEAT